MTPNATMCKILADNKVRVAFKEFGDHTDLWLNYKDLTKTKPNQGLDIWGHSQEVFDKIASVVRRYYPYAELASQGNSNVVYRLNGPKTVPVK